MAEIKIENVSKTYSSKEGTVQALKNVSLTIRSGEIYGIIGMSGAGKSTLVRCMNFLEQPTSGNVLIKGRALGGLKEKELRKQREQIGMIFQHFNLLMQKSVLENVCFPMYIQGKKKKEAREKAEELLEIVGLKEKANAFHRLKSCCVMKLQALWIHRQQHRFWNCYRKSTGNLILRL